MPPIPSTFPPNFFEGMQKMSNFLVPINEAPSGYLVRKQSSSPTQQDVDFGWISRQEGITFAPYGIYLDNTEGTAILEVQFLDVFYRIRVPVGQTYKGNYPGTFEQQVRIFYEGNITALFVNYPVN